MAEKVVLAAEGEALRGQRQEVRRRASQGPFSGQGRTACAEATPPPAVKPNAKFGSEQRKHVHVAVTPVTSTFKAESHSMAEQS